MGVEKVDFVCWDFGLLKKVTIIVSDVSVKPFVSLHHVEVYELVVQVFAFVQS
jgi:hypothetical protein